MLVKDKKRLNWKNPLSLYFPNSENGFKGSPLKNSLAHTMTAAATNLSALWLEPPLLSNPDLGGTYYLGSVTAESSSMHKSQHTSLPHS